jgi:EAL domain-containing protein (putative c-di-GMP-specific phosphodiesterase class I)
MVLAPDDPSAVAVAVADLVRAGDEIQQGRDLVAVVAAGLLTERDLRLLAGRVVAAAGPDAAVGGVGLAVGAPGSTPTAVLIEQAAVARRASARSGGAPVIFGDGPSRDEQRRADLAADLARGVEAGRIEAHLQPVADPVTGAITGFEALARWRDPVRQLVRPAAFMDVAAETGLLWAITEQVVTRALDWMIRWERATGRRRALLVPVHHAQVADQASSCRLIDLMTRCLTGAGAGPSPPSGWPIVLVPDAAAATVTTDDALIERLVGAGLALAVRFDRGDEAGSRLAGPGGAEDPRIATVLIGSDVIESQPGAATSLISRTQAQGRSVVVRDVATDAQLEAVRGTGASLVQGFRIHRPVAPERLESQVAAGAVDLDPVRP